MHFECMVTENLFKSSRVIPSIITTLNKVSVDAFKHQCRRALVLRIFLFEVKEILCNHMCAVNVISASYVCFKTDGGVHASAKLSLICKTISCLEKAKFNGRLCQFLQSTMWHNQICIARITKTSTSWHLLK